MFYAYADMLAPPEIHDTCSQFKSFGERESADGKSREHLGMTAWLASLVASDSVCIAYAGGLGTCVMYDGIAKAPQP